MSGAPLFALGAALSLLVGCSSRPAYRADPPLDLAPSDRLRIVQIELRGPSIGISTLVMGPDGTSVLIDVGNDAHADKVLDALDRHTGERAVDWILLSHAHADHLGAVDKLAPHLEVRRGVIHRGFVNLDRRAANISETTELCEVAEDWPLLGLCDQALPPDCDLRTPAVQRGPEDCAGLGRGALPGSPDAGRSHLPLGAGATLELVFADGYGVGSDGARVAGPEIPHDTSASENARSLAGFITTGTFTFWFGGDLTGGGKDTPDVETFVVGLPDLPTPDVVQLHHHGIRSSTNAAFVQAFFPLDGRSRSALVGANRTYIGAPNRRIVRDLAPRLGDGLIWAPRVGSRAPRHEALCNAREEIVIDVDVRSGRYRIEGGRCGARQYEPPP